MAQPNKHTDRRELRYLEQYGALVDAGIEALTIRLPRPSPLARPAKYVLLGWVLTLPALTIFTQVEALRVLISPLSIGMASLTTLLIFVFLVQVLLEALTPLERTMYTELSVSAQVIRRGPDIIPLESVFNVEVATKMGYSRLLITTDDGQTITLAEMGSQTALERLAVLIRRHVLVRRETLTAAGFDPSERAPAALEALRER